ncbi:MAG: hypothetical protein ABH848_06240 [Candidatus Omnitrophota bacterium]
MIKVEFSLAIGIYLILSVCLILLAWFIYEKKAVNTFVSTEKTFFWQCTICTLVYIDSHHTNISQCPRCKSFNKKEEGGLV